MITLNMTTNMTSNSSIQDSPATQARPTHNTEIEPINSQTSNRSAFNTLVLCLAFTSGFIIMSIELLGGRILAPYFGSSIHVWGSIITVFMMSLSIGYLLGGKLSLRNPSLTRHGSFYAGAAITLLPTIIFGNEIMDIVFIRIEDPRYGSLMASLLLFFLPTAVLGMIAPYSVRLLVKSAQESGQIAGRLYFISTFGSALGTLATSFYFVKYFEINQILFTMVAVLLLCSIIAVIADKTLKVEA